MSLYTIAEASEEVELTPYTLRYYEKEGLLPNVIKDSLVEENIVMMTCKELVSLNA